MQSKVLIIRLHMKQVRLMQHTHQVVPVSPIIIMVLITTDVIVLTMVVSLLKMYNV